MTQLRGAAVVDDLTTAVDAALARSPFFTGLRDGTHDIEHVRAVFGQYYLWRNMFHRWFGVCIAKSPAFGTEIDTEFILSELAHHIEEEISGDHHKLCRVFLDGLGVDAESVTPMAATERYGASFIARYMDPHRSGEEALAALAGRELAAPARNRLIIEALTEHYGVTDGLEFFGLHEDLEVDHFEGLWQALTSTHTVDPGALVEAARTEISEHVRFWDEVSAAVVAQQRAA